MDVMKLPLPPSLRTKLQAAGYLTLDCNLSPRRLAEDAAITLDEALSILKLVPRPNTSLSVRSKIFSLEGAKSAWDILCEEKARKRITTSCKELDALLGGGISPDEVTEISGVPGVGKTQLGMQLAINVQIPPECGGIGGHAVYIDTEGSFTVERAVQMTEACIKDITSRATRDPQINLEQIKAKTNINTFLSHIYVFRVLSATEQIAVVNKMESFMAQHSQVRLLVIDSVAFQFRQDFEDMGSRTRLLGTMAQTLMRLAEKHNLAIVLVNQVTQKMTSEGLKLLPALGETWSHVSTNRLIVYWVDGERAAYLLKSPSLPPGRGFFTVTAKGIESVEESNKRPKFSHPMSDDCHPYL